MEHSDIKLCWALMPLSEEELSKVPEGHRIRPYLLLKEVDGFYWAFPATSKAFSNKSRYVNSTLRINGFSDMKSLVLLDNIYKLPFENIVGSFMHISKSEENALFKRLKANMKYFNYPTELIDFINNKAYYLGRGDMIYHNGELYVIVGKVPEKEIYYSLRVYNHEVDGTILKVVDTNKYYVDGNQLHCIVSDDTTEYVSVMNGLSYGHFEKYKEDLRELMKDLQDMDKVSSSLGEDDFKLFGRLPIGTVISYTQDECNYKMIILDRDDKNTIVIFGLESQLYREFQVGYFPNEYNFSFNIISTLNEDRVKSLKDNKLGNNVQSLLQINRLN